MESARYRQIGTNWALITAGHFFDSGRSDYYIWSNATKLDVDNDTELYMDARVSPNSLTYYVFCIGNGNYTVKEVGGVGKAVIKTFTAGVTRNALEIR